MILTMKQSICCLVFLFLPGVLQSHAQTWSNAQQEVIEQLETCFKKLPEALTSGDLSTWLEVCPMDDDFAIWNTVYGAPAGFDVIKDLFGDGVAMATTPPIFALRPVRVKVVDDVAVMFYYVDIYQTDPEASVLNYSGSKRMTTLRRVRGHWQLVADMVVRQE